MAALQSNLIEDEGFLLRAVDYGDDHRILSFFTQRHGRVDMIALRAKKSRRRFSGLVDFLNHLQIDYQISKSGNLAQLQEVQLLRSYPQVRADYERLMIALQWCRLLAKTLHREAPLPRLFSVLQHGLSALQNFQEIRGVDLSFRYQTLAALGYELRLGECLSCQRQGEKAFFKLAVGGVHCQSCVPEPFQKSNGPFLPDTLWSLTEAAIWREEELQTAQNILTQAYQAYLS